MIYRAKRMLKVTTVLAQHIDNYLSANASNWKGKCLYFFIYKSFADKLSPGLKTLVYNPPYVLLALTAIYLVFCIIWFPLWLISLLFTWWGSMAFLTASVILGARAFARTIMFPGSTTSLQKQYSVEFLRRLSMQAEQMSSMSGGMANAIAQAAGSRPSKLALETLLKKFREVNSFLDENLPDLIGWLHTAVTDATEKGIVTSDEAENAVALRTSAEAAYKALIDIRPAAIDMMSGGAAASDFSSANNPRAKGLVEGCRRLAKASEGFTNAAYGLRPRVGGGLSGGGGADGDDSGGGGGSFSSGIFGALKSFISGTDGPCGIERLAFPIMREQIRTFYGGQRFSILGCDENIIDAVYIPCAATHHEVLRAARESSSASSLSISSDNRHNHNLHHHHQAGDGAQPHLPSTLGTVLFCSPNAGLYECVSQATREGSWVGFYTQLGFDVCLFNYRYVDATKYYYVLIVYFFNFQFLTPVLPQHTRT